MRRLREEVNWRWNSDDWVIDIQIEHPRLRSIYTTVLRWSRPVALFAIVISLLSNLFPIIAGWAIGAGLLTVLRSILPVVVRIAVISDIVALVSLIISITRVVTDPGGLTEVSATPLQAEETVQYSDEDC